ncbi:MAG: rod shape-determining protein MreC [Alphaproteobacteria bacterium]
MKKARALSQTAVQPTGRRYARSSIALVVALSLLLLAMHKTGNPALARLRMHVTDALVPVLTILGQPFSAVQSAAEWTAEMVALRQENVRLKNENVHLLQWQAAAREMEVENQSLRSLLKTVPAAKQQYITARIVSDMGGPYMHAALINAGSQAGVKSDQAVVASEGLLGRVVEAGHTSARVLMLSDINSRIPVMVEGSREKSILSGTGMPLPSLSYLPAGTRISSGERVVTSGDGGVFPPGIPVGQVVIAEDGAMYVQPFADPAKTSFVRTIEFSF